MVDWQSETWGQNPVHTSPVGAWGDADEVNDQ